MEWSLRLNVSNLMERNNTGMLQLLQAMQIQNIQSSD